MEGEELKKTSGSESSDDSSSGETGSDSSSEEETVENQKPTVGGERPASSSSVSKVRPPSASSRQSVGSRQSVSSRQSVRDTNTDIQVTQSLLVNYTDTLTKLTEKFRTQNNELQALDDITKYNSEDLRDTLEKTRGVLQNSSLQTLTLTRNIKDIRQVMVDLKSAMQEKLNKVNTNQSNDTHTDKPSTLEEKQAEDLIAAAHAALARATVDVAEAIKSAAEAETKAAEALALSRKVAEETLATEADVADAIEKASSEQSVDNRDDDKQSVDDKKSETEQNGVENMEGQDVQENGEEDAEEKEGKEKSGSNGEESSGSGSSDSSSGDDSSEEEESGKDNGEEGEGAKNSNDVELAENGNDEDDDSSSIDSFQRGLESRMSKLKEEPMDDIITSALYKYYVRAEGNEESELGCIIRAKQINLTENEITCTLANHMSSGAVGDNEELVSHVVQLEIPEDKKLSFPVSLAIPYFNSSRSAAAREAVVKATTDGVEWKVIPTTSTEGSYTDQLKKMFAEVNVTQLCTFAVIVRWTRDRLTVTKKGGTLKSTVDSRVMLNIPQGACGLTSICLQVQPVELTVVSDLKSRCGHCADLITSSPILHLTYTNRKEFGKPVSVFLNLPPNPTKETKSQSRPSTAAKVSRPSGGFVIRPRSAKLFGADHSDDVIYILSRLDTPNAQWTVLDTPVKQFRKDVVTFTIQKPTDRLLAVRYAAQSSLPVEQVAQSLDDCLQIKYACIILHHKVEDPEQVVVQIVQSRSLDSTQRKLMDMGYEAPPDPSPDLGMTEGQQIRLKFTGNIEIVDAQELSINFHAQRKNIVEFYIREANKYGNHSQPFYRGVAEFYGRPRVVIENKEEDPFEVDKEAKETKKDAKDAKKAREAREQKEKETKQKATRDLLCKLPVALPKGEPEPLRPPSRYRATALDAQDPPLSNESLRWLSTELGHEWETLANYLGIKRSRLQSIQRNNPNDMPQQIFDTLITWRSSLRRSYNKLPKLSRALTRCGRYDLADELSSR
ncbi:death domain-containing protein 1-like [Glandiceps talaboti]